MLRRNLGPSIRRLFILTKRIYFPSKQFLITKQIENNKKIMLVMKQKNVEEYYQLYHKRLMNLIISIYAHSIHHQARIVDINKSIKYILVNGFT